MKAKHVSVGIIGYGSFGSFLARKLDKRVNVKVFSPNNDVPKSWTASFDQVAMCDYVIPAIPLSAYEEVLLKLQKITPETTIIVDICSIKERPIELIQKYLPGNPLIATHPLFGPESAEKSLKGFPIILCEESHDAPLELVKIFLGSLGLDCKIMTAAEHDHLMAKLQSLTFFLARALERIGVKDLPIMTPSYMKLVSLADLEQHHSDELFKTIQAGNKFAKPMREQLLNELNALHKEITE